MMLHQGMEFINGKMDGHMKDNGKIIKCMGKVYINGLVANNMTGSFKME